MKTRRTFLKEVCPSVAFAFFGLSFLEACSTDGDEDTTLVNPGNGTNQGYSVNGKTYTIDLTHANFSKMATVGQWINGKNIGIPALLLRISSTEIQAYTNICPHEGVDNQWELLSNNTFRCNRHGRTYPTSCPSGLSCFSSSVNGNTLTVTMP